jgi:hypothetical protein
MGFAEISCSEHGSVHLDPTQIEARKISPGQIG